jgi:hypothetical protein
MGGGGLSRVRKGGWVGIAALLCARCFLGAIRGASGAWPRSSAARVGFFCCCVLVVGCGGGAARSPSEMHLAYKGLLLSATCGCGCEWRAGGWGRPYLKGRQRDADDDWDQRGVDLKRKGGGGGGGE